MKSIAERIAAELNVRVPQVDATIALLDGKATVPFIARYRKEATGVWMIRPSGRWKIG